MTGNEKATGALKVTIPTDREIAMTRVFDAPRRLVFDCLTKPELLKRWLGVRGGWELAVCEVDLKVGGTYRFVWRKSGVAEMGMGGVYREIVPPERLVYTESFDDPWYPGEALDSSDLVEHSPMGHALALGVVGLALSTAGAVVAITKYDLGPAWYPIALAVTALPCAWLGGAVHRRWHDER